MKKIGVVNMDEIKEAKAGCGTGVRSGGAAARLREKSAALPHGELIRRFAVLDDSIQITDKDVEEALEEEGISAREVRAALERLLWRIAATRDEPESSR